MEISVLLGNQVQFIFLNAPSRPLRPTRNSQTPPFVVSSQPSSPPPSTAVTTLALTLVSRSRDGPTNIPTKYPPKTVSISYKARQSAILDIQQSPDLQSALERSGGLLQCQDLNVVMRYLAKLNRLHDLSQVFDWMQQNGKTNIASYSSYMKLMGKSLHPMKAVEIYNGIEDDSTRTNVSVCNSVLSCLIKSGKYESSVKLFRKMKQDGLVPDIVSYSTLLAGCAKLKDGYSKALELIEELKYKGLQMDSVIYGTIISVCASNNHCQEAETYFSKMKDEGHIPNVFHYSSLLNAYAAEGKYQKAEEILGEMKSAGLVPNKVVLTTLLKVYVKGGLFERSRELLNELKALGYADEEMPYCLLMDGLAKAGQINEAKSVFNNMKEKHVKHGGYSYSIMISAFCRCGFLEDAKKLASEFEGKFNTYDVVILNTMLCAYCRAGEMENVMKIMKMMDKLAINPDLNTFHILVKYFCKEKLYLLAYQTLQDMHKRGNQLDEELCSNLIFHLGRTGYHSEAFSVYNMLRHSKISMWKALHEKILHILIRGRLLKDAYLVVKDNGKLISRSAIKKFASSFMRSGNVDMINDVIKAIHSSGYNIDQDLFFKAISRYILHPEKRDLLLQLLEWMPCQGYIVNSSMRNLILKNSHLFGHQRASEILSKQHIVSKA